MDVAGGEIFQYRQISSYKVSISISLPSKLDWTVAVEKLLKEGRYEDVEILKRLQRDDRLTFTPSRITDERSWDSYDDRNMIEFAATKKGIVVSNDQFRDLLDYYTEEKPEA